VFLKAGKKIQFVDINIDTLLVDEQVINATIRNSKNCLGILLNHSYGIEIDYNEFINSIKTKNNEISIIQDKCLCIPQIDNEINPNIDLVLYSTGYAKYCDLSFGGYGYTHHTIENVNFEFSVEQQKRFLKSIQNSLHTNCQFDNNCNVDSNWLDNRDLPIDTCSYFKRIQDTIPIVKKHKEEINKIYSDNLPKEIQLNSNYQHWRFNILLKNKEKIIEEIFRHKLFAGSHYPDLAFYFTKQKAQNAYLIHSKIINLFNDSYINASQALKIAEIINLNLT
jgi:hypothetical protein